ncbi:hypothetical protein F441_01678 [Phytophthora nicotianae CJ01A1]|uniref:Uncharacterized protein n=1 Tax=Phytophthora nicotianae CJ01A1 TaxID=1317063 RepID=W2XRW5_PHYNI|nr:hypothetical protein F441_01678 [Phytophthora nicotianae CJ01A1]
MLAVKDNVCKDRHKDKVRTKIKKGRKSQEHRLRTQALKNHDSMKQRPRRRRLQGNDKHLPDAGDRVTHEY